MSQELKINLASGVEAQLDELNKTLSKYLPLLVETLAPKTTSLEQPMTGSPKEPEPFTAPAEIQPAEPTPTPAEEPAPAPVEEPKPVEPPAPAAPSVTKEQVMNAGVQLMDKGMITELMALLKKYNSPSVVALPVECLDAVATDLRALGADI